ncbi:MAG: alanine--tRNA ligase [Chloroflexi bacterium]|nr:alanine--tRNA ligase [Chloroflexota bacterium]
MTSDELRQLFLDFFQDRGHTVIPSSSLIPHGDPSLLLTTAGMVQIKPYYLGLEKAPSPRLASCQKCFRTTDIDSVGDSSHLTFFEMLGNFSVGDYFKKEAIAWALEFATGYLKLPVERLWATIYLDDDEAFTYWQEVGIPVGRILRFGEDDNFWGPAGDSGPCGPCSELHYDMGEEHGCGRPECRPNCECGRYSEIWNLVFTQYDQKPDGSRAPLPRPNIDTGMGMERTAAVVQGKSSVYETDLFWPIVQEVCRLAGKSYGSSAEVDRAVRIIAEHCRGVAFLVADGVLPSNEGRGYVLRRILRRASLFGRRLGLVEPFLGIVSKVVIAKMGHVYAELASNEGLIREVMRGEEDRFISTLDTGLGLVEDLIDEALSQDRNLLAGHEVFRLYDTYGFPQELTAEIAKDRGLSVDIEGFQAEMEKQRERAREGTKFVAAVSDAVSVGGNGEAAQVEFVGYETTTSWSKVIALRTRGQSVSAAHQGDEVDIILDKTPFYGEMGGQVGDTGEIRGSGGKIGVMNTVRSLSDTTVQQGRVVDGIMSVGDQVEAEIDVARRLDIARNHTATHLVQAALRAILGGHVYQRGSLVEPSGFRFDFSHLAAITEEEKAQIQRWVNERIRENLLLKTRFVPYKQAIGEGVIALFEEKYGETVRIVEIGKPAVSKELCAGTHLASTGEIGLLLAVSESSIGTGLHRIEAVTGRGAESLIERRFSSLQSASREMGAVPEELPSKVRSLATELAAEQRRSLFLERELARRVAESLLSETKRINGVTVVAAEVPSLTMPVLREMGDELRNSLGSAIIVLASVFGGKPRFLAMVTPDLVAKGFHAGEIVRRVAKATGGSGGGKASMAQAGGRDVQKVNEALSLVESTIISHPGERSEV